MTRWGRSPPVVGLALAFGAGSTFLHLGGPLQWTPLLLPAFLLPDPSSWRPASLFPTLTSRGALFVAFLAGALLTQGWVSRQRNDCRLSLGEGEVLTVSGWLKGPLQEGRGELRPEVSAHRRCSETLRVVVPGHGADGVGVGTVEAGRRLALRGTWRRSLRGGAVDPVRSGYLRVDSLAVLADSVSPGVGRVLARMSGWVQSRLEALFPGTAPVAAALVLARKEGVPPDLREAFARAGTAHLLAISGFHVGVVAGVFLMILGALGLPPSIRLLVAGAGVWMYVATIGLPDSASRAALLLTLLALGRLAGRAVVPIGGLATAFLALLAWDPGALLRPGFQLSFAGASGLALAYRPLVAWLARRGCRGVPKVVYRGVAAGAVATAFTLPIVAWHFGRISLVGIPVTLLSTPLVALAIPGIFLALLSAMASPSLGQFMAAGVETVMELMLALTTGAASLPFASVWVSRPVLVGAAAAFTSAAVLAQLRPGLGGARLGRMLAGASLAGILMGPPLARVLTAGTVEIIALDVGQGDATLIRSPAGRWILVDAGPVTPSFDAGEGVVLPFLRRRGVGELDLLILTHPDMDHVGGASAVLASIPTRAVLDPGMPAGTGSFIEVLETARQAKVPWRFLRAGDSLNLDGMALRVLAPKLGALDSVPVGSNDASIVLELRFGAFSALLSGDAPTASELRLIPTLLSSSLSVLKVGHHGSATSTSRDLLARTKPGIALISVGRGNRFGHPDPEVLERLEGAGVPLFRTDEAGTIRVWARDDGTVRVSTEFRRG